MLEKSYTIISKQSLLDELIYSFNNNTIFHFKENLHKSEIFKALK